MLYKRTNQQLLSYSALYLTFYQQERSKNAMLKHFGRSITEFYQWDFRKTAILKRYTRCFF